MYARFASPGPAKLRTWAGRLRQHGFTLIELMITVVIIGILAAIAYPSYMQYVIRANRSAAESQMMAIASSQQQLFLANRAYADTGYVIPSELVGKYTYGLAVDNTATPPIFTITFAPVPGSSQAGDGDLTLTDTGVKERAGDPAKW